MVCLKVLAVDNTGDVTRQQGENMALQHMEHFLVLTDDIEGTRSFYRDVLGLEDGFRADLGFAGYWLYLGAVPVLHIADWEEYRVHSARTGIPVSRRAPGTGPLDHVAFNGRDVEAMVSSLQAHALPFHRNDVPQVGLVQLFVDDPNGIKIEMNFRG
jgi:catechol 2,3-dioxygenase-like lactoylglutathione lyase family enzyme